MSYKLLQFVRSYRLASSLTVFIKFNYFRKKKKKVEHRKVAAWYAAAAAEAAAADRRSRCTLLYNNSCAGFKSISLSSMTPSPK